MACAIIYKNKNWGTFLCAQMLYTLHCTCVWLWGAGALGGADFSWSCELCAVCACARVSEGPLGLVGLGKRGEAGGRGWDRRASRGLLSLCVWVHGYGCAAHARACVGAHPRACVRVPVCSASAYARVYVCGWWVPLRENEGKLSYTVCNGLLFFKRQ